MADPQSHELLDKSIEEWNPFKYQVIQFLEQKNDDSYRYILGHNEKLLDTLDRAVLAIQVHANQDQRLLAIVITTGIVIIFVILLYNFMKQLKQYRTTASRLAEIELLLPIWSNCEEIRTDNDHPFDPRSWTTVGRDLQNRKDMIFTHSVCPDCVTKMYPEADPEKIREDR